MATQKQSEVSVVYCGDTYLQLGGDKGFLIDVCTPGEFSEAHIPGSLNMPLPDLDRFLSELKTKASGKQIALVFCSGKRAGVAFVRLSRAGLEGFQVLHDGIDSWIREGYPVNRGPKAISIEQQVWVGAGTLGATGVALGVFINPWFLILPGFVGADLVFAGITDICVMGILLAKMPFNRAT